MVEFEYVYLRSNLFTSKVLGIESLLYCQKRLGYGYRKCQGIKNIYILDLIVYNITGIVFFRQRNNINVLLMTTKSFRDRKTPRENVLKIMHENT